MAVWQKALYAPATGSWHEILAAAADMKISFFQILNISISEQSRVVVGITDPGETGILAPTGLSLQETGAIGTTNYEYNGFGLLLEQTDARGTETENSYDWLNRLVATSIDGVKTTYNFGTSGNDTNLPVKEQTGNMTAEREYNEYGEVTKETKNFFNF